MPESPETARCDRWAALNIAELQQLLAAVMTAQRAQIFGSGRGNLLPTLEDELGAALDARVEVNRA